MRNVGILTASLLLVYLCTATVAYIHLRNKHSPPFMFGRPPGGFLRSGYTIATGQRYEEIEGPNMKDSYPYLEERWFDQKLDHFDPKNTKTWKQRYWYNPHYTRADSNLAFLFIGGEGPENGVWASNPNVTYIKLAAKYGALVLDLEHRFFGKSRPINDMKTESLLLCTTEQALADLAYFITVMNQQMGPFRWITWGGSYPGSLAAWFREKYPELTIGTVASSAPVNLKLDFWEYALQVEETLRETDQKCADAVDQAFGQIQQLSLTVAGRQKLNAYFNLDPPFNENTTKLDITNFQSNLYNAFQGIVQYTYDGQSLMTETNSPYAYTAQHVCQYMTNASVPDVIDRVNIIVQWTEGYYPTSEWGGFNKTNPFANSYWDMIKLYGNTTYDDENGDNAASYRGWMWLCCNEIGFLQTLDYGSKNIFHNGVPINFYFDMCVDLFGPTIDTKWVRDKNQAAQEYYGGATKYNTTNSILPNGSLDPWHQLGTYTQIDAQNLLGFVINGTAHCSDMYPVYDGEPPALVAARATVDQYIQRFIDSSILAGNGTATPTAQPTSAPTTKAASAFNPSTALALLVAALVLLF